MLELVPVQSNLFASLGHDGTSTMHVLYKRGGLYRVEDTSFDEFEQVLNPGPEHEHSVGKAFNALIKGRKPTFKVEGGSDVSSGEVTATTKWEDLSHKASPESREELRQDAQAAVSAIVPPEAKEVSRKSTELTVQAQAIQVVDPATQQQASDVLLAVAAIRKEIADTFKPMKDAAFKAHRVICDQEKTLDSPLAEAEKTLKSRIGSFVLEQQRLAREAEDRAREAERVRAAEEARQATELQAIEQACELEARGNVVAAEAVLANPAPVAPRYIAPAPIAPAVAQVKGVATRMEWDFRILDFNKIPREYLVVNEVAIRSLVKNTRGKANIPGVEAFEKPVVSASRRG